MAQVNDRCLAIGYGGVDRHNGMDADAVVTTWNDPTDATWIVLPVDADDVVPFGEIMTSDDTLATVGGGEAPPVPAEVWDPTAGGGAGALVPVRMVDSYSFTMEYDPMGGRTGVIDLPENHPLVMLLRTAFHDRGPIGDAYELTAAAGATTLVIEADAALPAGLSGDLSAAIAARLVSIELVDAVTARPLYRRVTDITDEVFTFTPAIPAGFIPAEGATFTVRVETATVEVSGPVAAGDTEITLTGADAIAAGDVLWCSTAGGRVWPLQVFSVDGGGDFTTSPAAFALDDGAVLRTTRQFNEDAPTRAYHLQLIASSNGWWSQGDGVVLTGLSIASEPGDRKIRLACTVSMAAAKRIEGESVIAPLLRNRTRAVGRAQHDLGGGVVLSQFYEPGQGETPAALETRPTMHSMDLALTVERAIQGDTAGAVVEAANDRARAKLAGAMQMSSLRADLAGEIGRARYLAWCAGMALPGHGIGLAVPAAHLTAEPEVTAEGGRWHHSMEWRAGPVGDLPVPPIALFMVTA